MVDRLSLRRPVGRQYSPLGKRSDSGRHPVLSQDQLSILVAALGAVVAKFFMLDLAAPQSPYIPSTISVSVRPVGDHHCEVLFS